MIVEDEDALTCDLAETYHLYDWRALPARTVAVLACGLRDDSRIMMKLRHQDLSMDRILSAAMLDRLSLLVWANSKDAQHNRNRPKSVLDELLGRASEKKDKIIAFDSAEDFRRAWAESVGG